MTSRTWFVVNDKHFLRLIQHGTVVSSILAATIVLLLDTFYKDTVLGQIGAQFRRSFHPFIQNAAFTSHKEAFNAVLRTRHFDTVLIKI